MKDVVIGIVNKDGLLLMIKRVKNEEDLVWAFPGGKVENEETKEEACIREVYEETGVNVSIDEVLGERIHPNTEKRLTYFLCNYVSGEITILNPDEVSEIVYKTQEEFDRDIKTDVYTPVLEYIRKNIK